MIEIVEAKSGDIEEIRRLAMDAFAAYGEYGNVLPRFFTTQGVHTYVARQGDRIRGFVMLGFLPWTAPGEEDPEAWVADLLAIAVDEEMQRQGLGRKLMARVDALVAEMVEWRDLKEVQLSCAADNLPALKFFESLGFAVADKTHGSYSGGQEAWRLSRKI